jgi:hypothetical protein
MIVLSRTLVLSEAQTYDPDNPVIGWDNLVTISNVVADTAATGYPASNLANPNTSQEWRANDTTDQYLTVETGRVDEIDYVALARHNFGSSLTTVSVEGQAADGGSWAELIAEHLLPDDAPVLYRFTPQSLFAVRVKFQPISTAPRAAVMYAGALLVMERGIWVGHTPLKHGRRVSAIDGAAESGDYLGSIVLGEWRDSSARFSLLDPDWYRDNMDAFLSDAVSERAPFFFAWRPSTYPRECGYARLTNNPDPVPTDPSHLLEVELQMRGIS